MKVESLREVKARLSKLIKDLPSERSVVITKKWTTLCGTFAGNERNGPGKLVALAAEGYLADV